MDVPHARRFLPLCLTIHDLVWWKFNGEISPRGGDKMKYIHLYNMVKPYLETLFDLIAKLIAIL